MGTDREYALVRAVAAGWLRSGVDADGFCTLLWRGIGPVSADQALELAVNRDAEISTALILAAFACTSGTLH